MNRTLQVRTANRLRADLPRERVTGLPVLGALSDADQRELCEVGGGRLTAVAICVAEARMLCEVTRLVDAEVRHTDLFGWIDDGTLVVLAPGLDPVAGEALADRLRRLLLDWLIELDGQQVALAVDVGSAHRSGVSPAGWTIRALAAEAVLHALADPGPITSVA